MHRLLTDRAASGRPLAPSSDPGFPPTSTADATSLLAVSLVRRDVLQAARVVLLNRSVKSIEAHLANVKETLDIA